LLGSFAQLRGGNRYPELIQDTPKKPLRVFLQAATRDLNWDAAELNCSAPTCALPPPSRNVDTTSGSTSETAATTRTTGGAILPDALRWLWRRDLSEPDLDPRAVGRFCH
jgi:hypothetical protein